MELNTELLKILGNGGIPVILFVIWFFTFKQSGKSYEQSREQFEEALRQSQKQFEEALAQNNKNYDTIFSIFREDVKYKALLTEMLAKIEIKLDSLRDERSRITRN